MLTLNHMKFVFSLKLLLLKYIIGISAVVIVGNFDIIEYGCRMGKGQMKIILNSKKIEKYLNDPTYPDSLKEKILLIQEIKKFTLTDLGFQPSPNYNKLYDQKGKPIMFVVTGCQKYSLKPMVWKFPVIGSVTYKGFFTQDEANIEAETIEKEGYESRIRIVNAWSTLGWFRDPIMSSMLNEAPGDIAEVIIHELSHGTIFIKNNVDLSENLANFIGEKGAVLFLQKKYGINSTEYKSYIQSTSDYVKFATHFIKSAKVLDSLYSSPSFIQADTIYKMQIKNTYINNIVSAIDTISFYEPRFFKNRFNERKPNNATFIVFRQYNSMQDVFETEFQKEAQGDLKKYIHFLINKYNK